MSSGFALQVPVVEDQAHADDIRCGQRVGEKVARGDLEAIAESCRRDRLLGDRRDDR